MNAARRLKDRAPVVHALPPLTYLELEFRRNIGFSSAAISWFGGDYWTHVDSVIEERLYSPLLKRTFDPGLLGARSDDIGGGRGVLVRPFDYETPLRKVRIRLQCTQDQKSKWIAFHADQLGKPYDWKAIWGFAFDRNWRDDGAWICSEEATRALEVGTVFPELWLHANKVTPGALALCCAAAGGKLGE